VNSSPTRAAPKRLVAVDAGCALYSAQGGLAGADRISCEAVFRLVIEDGEKESMAIEMARDSVEGPFALDAFVAGCHPERPLPPFGHLPPQAGEGFLPGRCVLVSGQSARRWAFSLRALGQGFLSHWMLLSEVAIQSAPFRPSGTFPRRRGKGRRQGSAIWRFTRIRQHTEMSPSPACGGRCPKGGRGRSSRERSTRRASTSTELHIS
jgi:hypothetical protein